MTTPKNDDAPPIQLIVNVVATNDRGEVLLVRYDPDDDRWWLPGTDLLPYEHPDEAVRRALSFGALQAGALRLSHVESFRGRRGWHVVFHYGARVSGAADDPETPSSWHVPGALPKTAHGPWEVDAVKAVLASAPR